MGDTAPFGCLRLGGEYLRAAVLVQPPPASALEAMRLRLSFPAYFLVGHAIELSLKAFLLGRKVGVAELRSRKYGHNLEALLRESRRRQIGREVPLNMKEVQAVLLLNECYCAKELEYVVVGLRTLPSYALIHAVASKLNKGLLPYVQRVGA